MLKHATINVSRRVARTCGQVRSHHPSPFDPMTTKGWKAAVKVRDILLYTNSSTKSEDT
jgi:hypothetical protein